MWVKVDGKILKPDQVTVPARIASPLKKFVLKTCLYFLKIFQWKLNGFLKTVGKLT